MRYLDTSIIVTALTREQNTGRIRTWLGEQSAGALAISLWVITEFSAALSIKLRMRQMTTEDRSLALAAFSRLARKSFRILAIDQEEFRAAAIFSDAYELGLRAGDALHVVIASKIGAELVTSDRDMARASSALGVPTLLL